MVGHGAALPRAVQMLLREDVDPIQVRGIAEGRRPDRCVATAAALGARDLHRERHLRQPSLHGLLEALEHPLHGLQLHGALAARRLDGEAHGFRRRRGHQLEHRDDGGGAEADFHKVEAQIVVHMKPVALHPPELAQEPRDQCHQKFAEGSEKVQEDNKFTLWGVTSARSSRLQQTRHEPRLCLQRSHAQMLGATSWVWNQQVKVLEELQ
mmetsp:Transcript_163648/g.519979  ORF Transcript_163648/g.519979 Transcript_163648/m.519979 type:complete len:210 (-) Transcript_163648:1030-1659(-)